jgi:uncharacterized protein (DUF433 family)
MSVWLRRRFGIRVSVNPGWERCFLARLHSLLRDNKEMGNAITIDPEIMHGIPVFCGTRVPVETLFEYLAGGETLEDFLQGFPTVPRDLAVAALDAAKQLLLTHVS